MIRQVNEWTEIDFKKDIDENQSIEIELFNENEESLKLELDLAKEEIVLDRSLIENHSFSEKFKSVQSAPANFKKQNLKIVIYKDASSIEIFINDGEWVMTALYFTEKDLNKMKITSNKSFTAEIKNSNFKSIW